MRDILDALTLAAMILFGWLCVSMARFGTRVDAALFESDGWCCQ